MRSTMMSGTIEPNDAELVALSLAEDREAFGKIVSRYQSLICSLTYSGTGSLSASEDLAQQTFLTAWQRLRQLREPTKLRAWLCGIARGLLRNAIRRQGHEPLYAATSLEAVNDLPAAEVSPCERAITSEEEGILWRSVERIPNDYREPLILFYRGHQSVPQVAEVLDLSEDTVKQRLSRGRKLLHQEVLAFVEGALRRTNPGRDFTLGVLAALPLWAAPASAATAALAAAHAGAGIQGTGLAVKLLLMTKSTQIIVAAAVAVAAILTPLAVHRISTPVDLRFWQVDAAALDKIPPVLILRQTRFARAGGSARQGNKILSKDIRVNELLEYAYHVSPSRMVLPRQLPREHFDLLLTLKERPLEALQAELRKRFGLTTHRETQEMDVLLLRVRNAHAPGLQVNAGARGSLSGNAHELTAENATIAELARNLEWRFGEAVVDQTGLTDHYDLRMKWEEREGESTRDAYQRAMVEQLGLELVPGREAIEMLMVRTEK